MQDKVFEGYIDDDGKPIPSEEMRKAFESGMKLERDSRVEIITEHGRTKLLIGGIDVSDFVTGFSYEQKAGELPQLHVVFRSPNISAVTDEAHVSICPSGPEAN